MHIDIDIDVGVGIGIGIVASVQSSILWGW
jgi:hypothetical protein